MVEDKLHTVCFQYNSCIYNKYLQLAVKFTIIPSTFNGSGRSGSSSTTTEYP